MIITSLFRYIIFFPVPGQSTGQEKRKWEGCAGGYLGWQGKGGIPDLYSDRILLRHSCPKDYGGGAVGGGILRFGEQTKTTNEPYG